MDRITRIHHTPWGPAQHVEVRIPGQVWAVSTMGHGGFYVTGAALERIPSAFRQATFTRDPHWYEEDVDWAIVAKFVPEAVGHNPEVLADAERFLKDFHKDTYAAWLTGQP